MNRESHQIAVIGGGAGGMAAAVAAFDSGCRDIVLLETDCRLGGVLPQCIHAGFGLHTFHEELTGPEYAARLASQVTARKIDVRLNAAVTGLTRDRVVSIMEQGRGSYEIEAGAVVLAVGCRERPAGALTIDGPRPAGIMTAGTAQRYINLEGYMVGRRAVILGSGDIGLIMARRLTLEGAEVVCVCELMPWSNGLQRNVVQCLEDFNIPLYLSTTVVGVEGKDRLTGVWVAPVDGNRRPVQAEKRFIPCDTLLLSVGLLPETTLADEAGIPLGSNGGISVDETRRTAADGIFACGNVVQVHDLVDYVAEEGTTAGNSAANWVLHHPARTGVCRTVRPGERVSCVVPERVSGEAETAEFFFRVRSVVRKCSAVVSCGDQTLARVRKSVMVPGEMQRVKVDLRGLPADASLAVAVVSE